MAAISFFYCPICATPLIEKYIYSAHRQVCPACNFIYFLEPKVVTVAVLQYEEKFLLDRRNIDPAKGLWSFISGYMERGEKIEEAAIREVKEETNLDVQLEQLIGIYSERGNPHIVIAYRASVLNNNISAMTTQLDEVSELAFFTLDTVPKLAFPSDQQILHDLYSLHLPQSYVK